MDETSKQVLAELFDALGFSEEEKQKALLDFQKKIAAEILRSVENELSAEDRDFVAKTSGSAVALNDPRVKAMREKLKQLHTLDEYREQGREILRKLLPGYVDYMAQDFSEDDAARLLEIVGKL